ncbi:MAG TPA: nucleotide pyrophosphohydrolase [Candidatus Saccharimonadales bacterium]|nr:nucleotide pyrophosphohydrolase [Candidatus Saccharimonadales bacterium]
MKNDDVLVQMQERIVAFTTERDWQQFHTPKDLAISLVLEATEVLEHFQWKNENEMRQHLEERKDDVGEELIDCLYWILLMAKYYDIDIREAFDKKMRLNEAKYPVKKVKGSHKKYTEYEP